MKQLVATAPRTLELLDYVDRKITENEILVKVLYASPKHGSEIADFRGTSPFIKERYDDDLKVFLPREPGQTQGVAFGSWNVGNMIVGRVMERGENVVGFEVGETIFTYGGIRETHIVNAVDNHRLHKLPDGVPWQNALCYDPAQFALGGIRDGNVRAGDHVAVFGLGAIGQIAVQIAKRSGASMVVGVDPIAMRRSVALQGGADIVLDSSHNDVGLELKKLSDKRGMDVIIETSGSKDALQASLRGLGYGGTISYVAWPKPFPDGLDWGREAHYNNAKIIFSRVASEPFTDHPRWNRKRIESTVHKFIVNNFIDCRNIIYPVVPFENSSEAYAENVDQFPERSIKLGISFDQP